MLFQDYFLMYCLISWMILHWYDHTWAVHLSYLNVQNKYWLPCPNISTKRKPFAGFLNMFLSNIRKMPCYMEQLQININLQIFGVCCREECIFYKNMWALFFVCVIGALPQMTRFLNYLNKSHQWAVITLV